MKTLEQLKEVFNDLASVLYQSTPLDIVMGEKEFSATSTYAIGDVVYYNGKTYKCKTAITAPAAWAAGSWDEQNANLTMTPEYQLPVGVDTFSFSQADPTINHFKVVGLDGDWTSSATIGDTTIKLDIPTLGTDILTMCWGKDAVTGAAISLDGVPFTGQAIMLKKKKIIGAFVLVNAEKDKCMIINNIALWAVPKYDSTSTKPFMVSLTGTVEVGTGGSIIYMEKTVV